MTKATRVHSTPPTNMSAIDDPPVDSTRRRLLSVAAAGAASLPSATAGEGINLSANTINVLAPKTPSKEITPSQDIVGDPTFALIAEKLAADVAHERRPSMHRASLMSDAITHLTRR